MRKAYPWEKIFWLVPLFILTGLPAGTDHLTTKYVMLETAFAASNKVISVATPSSFADLAEKLSPAVVNINTTTTIKGRRGFPQGDEMPQGPFFGGEDFFRRFFGDIPEKDFKQKSLGSGFIISGDGYIFTNNHVVEKADKIRVKLANGREYDAVIKGQDANTDIALIKINPLTNDLPVVIFGDSDKMRVGEWVFAIGNPFGLEQTVTAGIVSAKGRVIGSGPYDNFIQTDASINPGNSGGPLFNLSGEVIGINTAIVAQGHGIGFAIPINTAKEMFEQLKTKGRVTRGWLGVTVQEVTPEISENLKLSEMRGALVGDVLKGEPAEKAGIKTGDIIMEIDGKKIRDTHELLRIVASLPLSKTVDLKVIRNGKEMILPIKIGERKDQKELAQIVQPSDQLGMTVQEITPELSQYFGLSETGGVVITQVKEESPADDAGLKTQDIILQINKVKISSLKDYRMEISKSGREETLLILIKRGDTSFFVTLRKGTPKSPEK
jgi:serine protease Do